MSESTQTSSGIGLTGLLFIVFVVMKLTGHLAWSWFIIITSILWIPLGLVLFWMLFLGGVMLIGLGIGAIMAMFPR